MVLKIRKPGPSWETGHIPVLTSREGVGPHGDRGISHVSWKDKDLGEIHVGAAHYLTKGRKPGEPNWPLNVRFTNRIGAWGREAGAGRGLAFFHADFNMVDRTQDVFVGEPFTTVADDTRHWENTGHGNIDGIAKFDGDGRTDWTRVRVLDDKELHLFTDHFLMEAWANIRKLGSRETKRVKMAHCSMQFSDSEQQMKSDLRKLFERNYYWLTGTEAGGGHPETNLKAYLHEVAPKYGYKIYSPRGNDAWVAVDLNWKGA